jgi:hypothetical protein
MSQPQPNNTTPNKKTKPKSKKLPALQFYPGDWKRDIGVQSLEPIERYVWFEMLLLMHESEERGVLILNGRPMSHKTIAQALNLDNQITTNALTSIVALGVCGVRGDGAIFSRKMVRDEEISAKRAICGSRGGNPNLLNQKSTPSSSSSSSSSSSIISIYIEAPPSFKSPELDKLILSWQMRLTQYNRTLDQIGLEALCSRFGTPDKLKRALEYTLSLSKALNVIEPPEPGRGGWKKPDTEEEGRAKLLGWKERHDKREELERQEKMKQANEKRKQNNV